MPLKTLVARTSAVLVAIAAAGGSVIALEPGPASAGSVAPQATTVTTTTPLTVAGTVTDYSGATVIGATVNLLDSTSGTVIATGTTNTAGAYLITAPAAGTYYVQFVGDSSYQTQYLGGSQVAAGSQTVTLTSTTSVTGANATLQNWNYPGITQTVTTPPVTNTVTTGTPGITINQAAPATTVTKTVTTAGKTVTVTKTVTSPAKTVTKTTTTPVGGGSSTAPSVASGSLGGIGARDVELKFKVVAGANTGGLKSFQVKLPKGFAFSAKKLKTGFTLGKLNFTDKLSGGTLEVTLKSAQKTFSASFGAGAITTTTAIVRNALIHKIASEKITLSVTDAKGTKTALPFVIAKPS